MWFYKDGWTRKHYIFFYIINHGMVAGEIFNDFMDDENFLDQYVSEMNERQFPSWLFQYVFF